MKITMAVKMELSVKWHILGRRGSREEREGEGGKGKKERGGERGGPGQREHGRLICSQASGELGKGQEDVKRCTKEGRGCLGSA